MAHKLHRFTVDVEYNSNPTFHPVTVTVTRNGETREFSGRTLPGILAHVSKHITQIEEEEA